MWQALVGAAGKCAQNAELQNVGERFGYFSTSDSVWEGTIELELPKMGRPSFRYESMAVPSLSTSQAGRGGTYAPFPQLSLGPNDVTTTPVTDRDYAVGFVTSELAPVPEPNYAPILALCLGTLLFFQSCILSDRPQKR